LDRSERWVLSRQSHTESRIRLFCLPHAGGGSSAFHGWHAAFPSTVQVLPVLLPGREGRLSEPLIADFNQLLTAMEEALSTWLDGPFAIFGHSMGALLAFEWARRLEREGTHPMHLFVSGRRAPDCPHTGPLLTPLPDPEFLQVLADVYHGLPDEILQEKDLMDVILPVLRADLAVVESYAFSSGGPLTSPITAFAGADDETVSYNQLLGWGRHTTGRFKAGLLPGGHFFSPKHMIETIATALETSVTGTAR
jgi:medium-chain acyl-[acyl-carrier-protein] hydrolase